MHIYDQYIKQDLEKRILQTLRKSPLIKTFLIDFFDECCTTKLDPSSLYSTFGNGSNVHFVIAGNCFNDPNNFNDIDIFMSQNVDAVNPIHMDTVRAILESLNLLKNRWVKYNISETTNAFTCILPCGTKIQIIKQLADSPTDVLKSFDLSHVMAGVSIWLDQDSKKFKNGNILKASSFIDEMHLRGENQRAFGEVIMTDSYIRHRLTNTVELNKDYFSQPYRKDPVHVMSTMDRIFKLLEKNKIKRDNALALFIDLVSSYIEMQKKKGKNRPFLIDKDVNEQYFASLIDKALVEKFKLLTQQVEQMEKPLDIF